MPYISQPSRAGLDAHIDALANEIRALAKSEGHDAAFCGPLNYACTKLALQVIPVRRYWTIALVVGVFKNIADEFYRRYAVPYEDEKMPSTATCTRHKEHPHSGGRERGRWAPPLNAKAARFAERPVTRKQNQPD
jgi:hypothetical protein